MKKIFFIFLLLGSVILSGCGSDDYEDPSPRVEWTSPRNGDTNVTETGDVVVIKFSLPMEESSVNITSVSVTDTSNNTWPAVDKDGVTSDNLVTTSWSEDATEVTFTQTNFLKFNSCFKLSVSTNVRSAQNKTLESPYIVNFGTDGKVCP